MTDTAPFVPLPLFFRVVEMHASEEMGHTVSLLEVRATVSLPQEVVLRQAPTPAHLAQAQQTVPPPPYVHTLRVSPQLFAQCHIGQEYHLGPATGVAQGLNPRQMVEEHLREFRPAQR